MTDTVRYGVLSTSQIARNRHIPAARETTNSEIVAISSREKGKAEEWAAVLCSMQGVTASTRSAS